MNDNQFNVMSAEAKRVEIAKDVIVNLNSKRFQAEFAVWLNLDKPISAENINNNVELQPLMKDMESCTACALGGIFACAVERFNDLKTKECFTYSYYHNFDKNSFSIINMKGYLEKFFDHDQIVLIEICFESGQGGYDVVNDKQACAAAMYYHISNPETRMRAIMGNIIENNGQFVVAESQALRDLYYNEIEEDDEDSEEEEELENEDDDSLDEDE